MQIATQKPRPTRVVLHAASQVLEIAWSDGTVQRTPAAVLRERCPCSGCEAARRAGRPVPSAVSFEAALPAGEYGVQLRFSDEHDRGIYPWEYLWSLHRGHATQEPTEPTKGQSDNPNPYPYNL